MIVTVNRRELLSAVQNAEAIVPASTTLEALKCVYLMTEGNKITLSAGNMELALEQGLPAVIQEDGSAALNAKMFSKALALMTGMDVTISQESNTVKVIDRDTVYTFSGVDTALFTRPAIPAPELSISVSGLCTITKGTVFAASRERTLCLDIKHCVRLQYDSQGSQAVCTDGVILAFVKGGEKSSVPMDLLLPASSLEKLARMISDRDTLELGIEQNMAVFRKQNFFFAARLVSGTYPDVDKLVASIGSKYRVLTDAEALRKAVGVVSTVLDKKSSFSLEFEHHRITLSCEGAYGTSLEILETVALSGTPSGKYWYDPRKLSTCLKALKGTLTLEVGGNGVLLLRTENQLCMLMAMREPKRQAEEPKPREKKSAKSKKKEEAAQSEGA